MTPEQRERVAELFEATLQKDLSQRRTFLEEACGDEKIRAEVRSLLEEHEAAGSFMQQPILGWASLPPNSKSPVISQDALSKISERYEILEKVGSGGMGIVYRARDQLTGEFIALKILRPDAAGQGTIERFKNELRLARKVTHKNVCRIHEFNVIEDVAYISMEFVEGETLREVLTRFGGLPLQKAIQIVQQICDGLREAHNQGIIHRDLKPENVMIDRAGNAKIMDFGIARSVDTGITQGTVVIGTPAYMAPEQAEGKSIDARTDIYAVGLLLYEILTGRPTFRGDTPVALAVKQVSEIPPRPRELQGTIPPNIEDVILRCLEKNPDNRFQSVDDLEIVLTKSLEVVSSTEVEPSRDVPSRVLTLIAGRPRATMRLVILCSLLTASVIVAFFVGKQGRPVAKNDLNKRPSASTESANSPMHHDAEVYWVAFSPNGRLLASASEDKTIKLWDLGTQRETHTLVGHTRAVTSVAFSPDGRRLASASSDKTLKVWDVESGQLLRTLGGHSDEVNSVAFSPDGRWLISGSADKTVRMWDPETGELKRALSGHTSGIEAVCFSPDGKWIASASYDETVRLWDAVTGIVAHILRGHADRVETIAFSTDSHWLASGSDDNMIKLWDVSTGQVFRTLSGHTGWVNCVSFSPNGKELASGSADATVKLWQISSGRQLLSLNTETAGVASVVFSPDANQIATGDSEGNVRLWPLKK